VLLIRVVLSRYKSVVFVLLLVKLSKAVSLHAMEALGLRGGVASAL
jgi:hypothetical protein